MDFSCRRRTAARVVNEERRVDLVDSERTGVVDGTTLIQYKFNCFAFGTLSYFP